ncbi:MAG TPA: aldo/keto reductase, partial [Acidimicrobiia bacterium]|nr:aldo/keto reductase [Acidimicrobiia bacterium]
MSIGAAERSGVRVAGVSIGNIGFGAFNLSLDPRPSRTRATRTIHAALDAGIRLIDTADAYCRNSSEVGHNERLLRAALRSWRGDRDGVLVVTKGGHVRTAA